MVLRFSANWSIVPSRCQVDDPPQIHAVLIATAPVFRCAPLELQLPVRIEGFYIGVDSPRSAVFCSKQGHFVKDVAFRHAQRSLIVKRLYFAHHTTLPTLQVTDATPDPRSPGRTGMSNLCFSSSQGKVIVTPFMN